MLVARKIKGAELACVVLLAACSGTEDRVTFVTTTQLNIVGADGNTGSLDVGYSRMEGVIGPVYDTGAIPPVFAEIKSNGSLLNPKVSQTYATGEAARYATGKGGAISEKPMTGTTRKTMFFGTNSNIGLKLGFAPNPSINLGYKRQEFSIIPIVSNSSGDQYGSTIAHLEMNVSGSKFTDASMGIGQFIATGDAAERLAQATQSTFIKKAQLALKDCKISESEDSKKLREAITGNNKNRTALKDWLKREGIDMFPTTFAEGDCYPEMQKKAVADLGF